MYGGVSDRPSYHVSEIADLFIRSKFNDVCFDGSDLPFKVKEYLFANHKHDKRVGLSNEYIMTLSNRIVESFQKEIRYRFDD